MTYFRLGLSFLLFAIFRIFGLLRKDICILFLVVVVVLFVVLVDRKVRQMGVYIVDVSVLSPDVSVGRKPGQAVLKEVDPERIDAI